MSKRLNITKLSDEINNIKKNKNNIIDELIILLKSNGSKQKEIQLQLKIKKLNNNLEKKLKKKEELLKQIYEIL